MTTAFSGPASPSPFISSSNPLSSYILDAQDTLDLLRDECENLDFQYLDFSGSTDKSKAVSVKIECLDAPGVIKMASDVAECLLDEPWSCVAAVVSATMLLRTVLDAASLRDTDALAHEMQPLLWSAERIRIGADAMLSTFRDFERERLGEASLCGAWAMWKGSLAEQCDFVVESVEKLIGGEDGSQTSRSLIRVVASAARATLDEARRNEAQASPSPPSIPRGCGPNAQSCSAAGAMTLRLVLYGGDKTVAAIGSRLSEAGTVASSIASAAYSGIAWQRNLKRLAGLEQVRAALEHLSMFVARAARLHPCAEDRLSEPDFRGGCRRTLEFALSLIYTLLTDSFVRKHPLTLAPGRLRARADGCYEHGDPSGGAHMADVVLVSGIEADVLHTFSSRFREFWPTAMLAPDLGPSVRLVALQPPMCPLAALAAAASRPALEERARSLLLRLEIAGVGSRPFVVFAYSFGGVLAKAMYVAAAEDDRFRRFFKCCQGIVFASVPHAPADVPRLVSYIARGCPAAQRAVAAAEASFAEPAPSPPRPVSPPRPRPVGTPVKNPSTPAAGPAPAPLHAFAPYPLAPLLDGDVPSSCESTPTGSPVKPKGTPSRPAGPLPRSFSAPAPPQTPGALPAPAAGPAPPTPAPGGASATFAPIPAAAPSPPPPEGAHAPLLAPVALSPANPPPTPPRTSPPAPSPPPPPATPPAAKPPLPPAHVTVALSALAPPAPPTPPAPAAPPAPSPAPAAPPAPPAPAAPPAPPAPAAPATPKAASVPAQAAALLAATPAAPVGRLLALDDDSPRSAGPDSPPSPPALRAIRAAAAPPSPPSPRSPSPPRRPAPPSPPRGPLGTARSLRPAMATLHEDFVRAVAGRPEKPFETLCLRAVRAAAGAERAVCGEGFEAPFNVNSAVDEEHLTVCRVAARSSPAYAHLLTFVRETLGVGEPDALYSSPAKTKGS